jgi:hypothetical protein
MRALLFERAGDLDAVRDLSLANGISLPHTPHGDRERRQIYRCRLDPRFR